MESCMPIRDWVPLGQKLDLFDLLEERIRELEEKPIRRAMARTRRQRERVWAQEKLEAPPPRIWIFGGGVGPTSR